MRKNKYLTHVAPFLREIGQMARNGATEAEIAKKLGVAYSTFRRFKSEHEELKRVLLPNKEMADFNVEASLYKRANGYWTEEIIEEAVEDPETGEVKLQVVKRVSKEVPPDSTAIIFFLKNRRPDLWSDRQSVEISAPITETAERIAEILKDE